MPTSNDYMYVKEVINSFYIAAGFHGWNRKANEKVAEIFGKMVAEVRSCSSEFLWVPRPPSGRATISWLVKNFNRSVLSRMKGEISQTCAKAVIYRWGRELDRASLMG